MINLTSTLNLVNQPTENTCTSACLAMLTGAAVADVIAEFHTDWLAWKTTPKKYLAERGLTFIENASPFNRLMEWDKVYLLTVASLNKEGGLHHIVVDLRTCPETVLDPNNGKLGKKYYVGWSEQSSDPLAVALLSWCIDGEVK